MFNNQGNIFKWILIMIVVVVAGCASTKRPLSNPQDPYENFNRKVFAFNMAVDKAFFRPIAKVYDNMLPWPIKRGVRNVFCNLGDVNSAANEMLQLHFGQAVADLARVVINTIVGLGGLFDVATSLGLERDKEDFGLTLGVWGSNDSPYLILPFLGPSTIRDTVALPVDYLLSVWPYIEWDSVRYSMMATNLVQRRATLLAGDNIVDQAFDPYLFVRDAYLQRRSYLVKESQEEHEAKYVDDNGITHRKRHTIPAHGVLAN